MRSRLLKFTVIASSFIPYTVLANPQNSACDGVNSVTGGSGACTGDAFTGKIGNIVNVALYIAGALAVLVIIYSGIRYITSTGDAARIKAAKDTLIYAIVGLIVAMLAYAIVNFVIGRFGA